MFNSWKVELLWLQNASIAVSRCNVRLGLMQICLKQKMAGLLGAAYFPRKIRQLVLRCVIRMCERRLHIVRVFEKKKPEVHKCSFPGFGLGPVALCRG